MIDEPGFLAQLYTNPADDTTRLVYADWLEERGDRRGAYLRQEVEVAGLDEWSDGYRDRERELSRLRQGLPAEWLELAGRRYDVWLVDLPADPPGLTLLLLTLCRLGRGPLEAAGMLGQLPQAVIENALRPAAEEVRETLLAACQAGEEPPASEVPVRLRLARAPRPKLCRYPGPGEAPGYALRLVERTRKKRPALEDAVRRVLGGGEDAGAAVEGELPRTLRTFATPEEARRAAGAFKGLATVEVRHVEPPPAGRLLDRPLVGRFAVVLHRYPPEVKRHLLAVLRLMTGCSAREARRLAAGPLPLVVGSGLDWQRAEALRLALPARAWVEVREEIVS
jgi:uncharacterized protein (TIGR02996 family)